MPVLDDDMTQPMRFPTGTVSAAETAARRPPTTRPRSGGQGREDAKATKRPGGADAAAAAVRQRADDNADEVTAVIDLSGAVRAGNSDVTKDGDGK